MIFGLIALEGPYVESRPPSYKGHGTVNLAVGLRVMVFESIVSGRACPWMPCRRRTRAFGIRARSLLTVCGCTSVSPLSFREVEELMLERGVTVSYESVRQWCAEFGQAYANQLRRRRPRPGDKWYMDEVFLKINGKLQYLWRAVDQDGNVLDILVQSKRNTQAAKRFFHRLLKEYEYVPRVIVTDKRRSYGAAPPPGHALRRAPVLEVPEQPGREQPPANEATGTRHAALHLTRARPEIPVCLQRHLTPLPPPPPPTHSP
jgi:putative transposase